MFKINTRPLMMLGTAVITLGLAAPAIAGHHMDGEKASHAEAAVKTDIVDAAIASEDHTTLVAAVQAAGLVETLKGEGPFTVFAPTNAAFEKLPAGTVDTLLQPENKGQLTSVLTYHVVPGQLVAADIAAAAEAHNGTATFTTVQGDNISVMKDAAGDWWITDVRGGKAKITAADLKQSNGTLFVIDTVLMPAAE